MDKMKILTAESVLKYMEEELIRTETEIDGLNQH